MHAQLLGPGGGVGAGAVQHPGAELGGEPVVLGGVEEGRRRKQTAGRVLPADRAPRSRAATRRRGARSAGRRAAAPRCRCACSRSVSSCSASTSPCVERALVHLDAGPAAVGLGAGQRALRLAQQVVGGHVGAEGEPDARRQGDLALVHDERLVEHAEQPVGQRAQAVEVLDVLGDDEELVGTQPDGGVLDAGAPAQPVGDLAEQHVAGLVAQRLVDRLEPVDVQVHEPDLQPAAAGERDGVPQPVGEGAAVGQAGERVDEGPADQVVLGPAAVGDVHQREDDELRRRRCCAGPPRATGRPTARVPSERRSRRSPSSSRFGSSGGSPGRGSRPRSPTGGSSGWARRSTCRPASSSAVRPVRAHIIGFATSMWPSRSTSAFGIGAERNRAWKSWPRSASRVSMARMR